MLISSPVILRAVPKSTQAKVDSLNTRRFMTLLTMLLVSGVAKSLMQRKIVPLMKNPGGRKGVPRDIKCEHCSKDFIHQKDYKYHLKTAHASRAGKKTS